MPRYEMYNTQTEQLEDIVEMSGAEAEQRNKDNVKFGSPYRYTLQAELPDSRCTCGAETRIECVCEFPEDHMEYDHVEKLLPDFHFNIGFFDGPDVKRGQLQQFEYAAIKQIDDETAERVQRGQEDHWSVYVRYKHGLCYCICDCKTETNAETFVRFLSQISDLPYVMDAITKG